MTPRYDDGPETGDDGREPGIGPTRSSARVAAPVDVVMGVISDFADYPTWAEAVRETEVLSTGADGRPERVRFVLDAGPVSDDYVLRYSWSADGRSVEWRLESSTLQRHQHGVYRLTPVDGGTEVDYELEVQLSVPMIGRVRSRAERRIVGAALSELRRRAEGLAGDAAG